MSIRFNQTTLDNGLTIIAEPDDAAHTAAVGFHVKTGARDEPAELMGVSHFLEHMMFKGTARRTAADVNRDFDRIGASYNASTSHEVTTYHAHILPEYMPEAIDLLSDMLRPALRVEDFTTEKQVILEEIGMYADRPFWVVYEQALERFYGLHPLSFRVLGTVESITALTRDQMQNYFSRRVAGRAHRLPGVREAAGPGVRRVEAHGRGA
jgi:predicted Zn-dependent peptidase